MTSDKEKTGDTRPPAPKEYATKTVKSFKRLHGKTSKKRYRSIKF